jgi:hypothetical protein
MAVDISLVEVVPLLLVLSLPQEHAAMGTTSAIRNSQLYSLATKTKEYPLFRRVIT